MASAQTILDLWQSCERHRISLSEIRDLICRRFHCSITSIDDAKIADMIGHIDQVEKARHELLARLPMRPPVHAEEVADDTIEVEADRDDDDDQVELETDADRYPRPKGDEADAFDIHDNTIGYDHPDEDGDEENFPEPDDIAPIEPASVAVQPIAPAPVTPPAEQRTPASQSVVTLPPSARLPRRRPPVASPASAPPAKSDEQPAQQQSPKGLVPRTDMGFFPISTDDYDYDLSPEAIKKATWDNPVPRLPKREAAGPSPSVARMASPSAASTEAPPADPHLKPIRRPAWLGTIAEEDPPD